MARRVRVLGAGVAAVVLIVLLFAAAWGLLWATRDQTPRMPRVGVTQPDMPDTTIAPTPPTRIP